MQGCAASSNGRRQVTWLRKHGFAARLGAYFLWVTLVSLVVEYVEYWNPESSPLWVANGLILAYLLLVPRRRWPAYLLTGFLALSVRSMFFHPMWNEFLFYNALNILEVITAALLMRQRSTELPRFTERTYLLRFIGFAVLAGPALAAGIFALSFPFWKHPALQHPFLSWMVSDGLGIAIATPAIVAVLQTRLRNAVNWQRHWFYPVLLLVAALAAFSQNTVPLVYLIYPLLVLVLVRLGLGYTSLFTLLVASIAGVLTVCNRGPFAASGSINPALPNLHVQAAIAAAIVLIYSISVVLEQQKSTERKLQEIVSLHRLVSENSRDVIIVSDFDGNRTYVSAAVQNMFGWKPEEATDHTGLQLVHPEDLHKAEVAMREMQSGREDALVECRVRKANGEYLWVEAALRLIRDPGTGLPSGILKTVRDIGERKRSEQQLREAYRAVEALALTDVLTSLANRRRFDQYLAIEWRRSMRDCQPLSLLMLDVDLFKAYNDIYGHQRGDSCLKQIAEACRDVVSRPGDLVARFGGEEFVIVLPNTESEGALQVGNEICESLRGRRLPHSNSPFAFVTISIGCATLVPQGGRYATDLIAIADHALYNAKHNGRNQVCLGNALEKRGEVTVAFALPEAANGTTS
ncbi:MAG: diguanylate cyclase domain-containing protein [Terracidiphilus sp.]